MTPRSPSGAEDVVPDSGRSLPHGAPLSGDTHYDRRPPFAERLARRALDGGAPAAKRLLRAFVGGLGFLARPSGQAIADDLAAEAPRRILVIRVDLIGDVVLSLAAVHALKRTYPNAEIDMLVLPSSAGILAAQPDLNRVLTFDPYLWRSPGGLLNPNTWRAARTFVSTLRSRRYDVALSVAGDVASILARLSGARRRIGYDAEAYAFMLTQRLPGGRYRKPQHEIRYVLDLARAAGATAIPGDEQARLDLAPEAAEKVCALLTAERRGLGRRGPVVALHPGARNGQAKRWPTSHLAALADRLVGELDALVVIAGGPGERPIAAEIVELARRPLLNLCGETTLPELAALLQQSDVVVSGDSGPMHIACAVGSLVVALHGPTDPGQSGPTSPSAIVVRQPLWCSPCYHPSKTAECRFGNPVCMKELSPELVFAAVRRQLLRSERDAEPAAHAPDAGRP